MYCVYSSVVCFLSCLSIFFRFCCEYLLCFCCVYGSSVCFIVWFLSVVYVFEFLLYSAVCCVVLCALLLVLVWLM